MNWQAVTSRRELWISLLALLVIALMLPVYIVMEPTRLQAAELQILQSNLDEAMTLYAQNCALVPRHGRRRDRRQPTAERARPREHGLRRAGEGHRPRPP